VGFAQEVGRSDACTLTQRANILGALDQWVSRAGGTSLTRAELHISRSRDGELFTTLRQVGMIRMLVPGSSGTARGR
jgi:hypothetical protein